MARLSELELKEILFHLERNLERDSQGVIPGTFAGKYFL